MRAVLLDRTVQIRAGRAPPPGRLTQRQNVQHCGGGTPYCLFFLEYDKRLDLRRPGSLVPWVLFMKSKIGSPTKASNGAPRRSEVCRLARRTMPSEPQRKSGH
jgi:hypothetical protein